MKKMINIAPWVAGGLVVVGIILALLWTEGVQRFLFANEEHFSRSDIITYFGVAAGGIILLAQLMATNMRIDLQEKSNCIQAQGNLDARFKDASMLLGSENTSSILAGIYALHQVAVEASQSKSESQRGYIEVVENILCSFIRENSEIIQTENGIEGKRKKPDIAFQAIIDLLFRNDSQKIYIDISADLSESVLNGLELREIHLDSVHLEGAYLEDAHLEGAYLQGVRFNYAILKGIHLESAYLESAFLAGTHLESAYLEGAHLEGAYLEGAYLESANLEGAHLECVHLGCAISQETRGRKVYLGGKYIEKLQYLEGADLRGADLSKSELSLTDFSNAIIDERTNFTGTIHQGKTVDEIKAYKPPIPKNLK
ncbi:MAG: pentapeptide repeat-containing protein [Mediterranea sp.]|jgi:uncharacterized protein YjbI with pentapeptide repeats|nr:pentapeptide repeat-containing protein [Mediterranea sp.]